MAKHSLRYCSVFPLNKLQVYDKVIDEDRVIEMRFEKSGASFNVTYHNKTLSAGFEFLAWSSSDETLTTLGYGYTNKFRVTNKTAIGRRTRHLSANYCCSIGIQVACQLLQSKAYRSNKDVSTFYCR